MSYVTNKQKKDVQTSLSTVPCGDRSESAEGDL